MQFDLAPGGANAEHVFAFVGEGAKLSIKLFQVVSPLESAGDEVRAIAVEISLVCSIARKLERSLRELEPTSPSYHAVEATSELLEHCSSAFRSLDVISNSILYQEVETQSERLSEKKLELQIHRATLESCKITMDLILSTLDFAARNTSHQKPQANIVATDEQNEDLLLVTLLQALRCSFYQLERLEFERAKLATSESLAAEMEAEGFPNQPPTMSRSQPTPEYPSKCLQSLLPSRVGHRVPNLLARWTTLTDLPLRTGFDAMVAKPPESSLIFKSFRFSEDSPCHQVLPIVLKKLNIGGDWRQYDLLVLEGDKEHCIGLNEHPLAIFRRLDVEGRKPTFIVRRRKQDSGDEKPVEDSHAIGSRTDKTETNTPTQKRSLPTTPSGGMSPTPWSQVDTEETGQISEVPALPE